MATTGRTLCTDAMLELAILQAGETPNDTDIQFVLRKLNRVINNWNAEREAIYATDAQHWTIVPGVQPQTIGPTGLYVVTQRPVAIDAANIILNNVSPVVRNPFHIRDYQWWALQSVQGVTSTLPTDLYYKPSWPNGELYLWPVPTQNYQLELFTRGILDSYTLDTVFSMPPGYQDALTLTLAEEIASGFSVTPSATTVRSAAKSRDRIFSNNRLSPRLTTYDAGMPPTNPNQGYFNYRTGMTMPGSVRSN